MAGKTITAPSLADRLEVDPKLLRKFLRTEDSGIDPVHKGHRYEFTEAEAKKIMRKFEAWQAAHTRTTTEAAPKTESPPKKSTAKKTPAKRPTKPKSPVSV